MRFWRLLSRPVAYYASSGFFNVFRHKKVDKDSDNNCKIEETLPEGQHEEIREDSNVDSKSGNNQYSYASTAWAGAAAVGRVVSTAASSSWNNCRDTRALQYVKLETILIFLQRTKNLSVETGMYVFDVLKKTFFSSIADDRIRFMVLRAVELLLGMPVGPSLVVVVIPFLKSAIDAIYQEKDSESSTLLLRIIYTVKDYAPQLLALAVPLFFSLPDKLDFENLKTAMYFAQYVIEYIQPSYWKKILSWCLPYIGYDHVKGFGKILGIDEKELNVNISQMNNEALEVDIESKEIIVALLRALIITWLKQGYGREHAKLQKSKL